MRAFQKRMLRCVGPLGGGECTHAFDTDAKDQSSFCTLTMSPPCTFRDLTCSRWATELPMNLTMWDDGLDGYSTPARSASRSLVCTTTHVRRALRALGFRCDPRRASGMHVLPRVVGVAWAHVWACSRTTTYCLGMRGSESVLCARTVCDRMVWDRAVGTVERKVCVCETTCADGIACT